MGIKSSPKKIKSEKKKKIKIDLKESLSTPLTSTNSFIPVDSSDSELEYSLPPIKLGRKDTIVETPMGDKKKKKNEDIDVDLVIKKEKIDSDDEIVIPRASTPPRHPIKNESDIDSLDSDFSAPNTPPAGPTPAATPSATDAPTSKSSDVTSAKKSTKSQLKRKREDTPPAQSDNSLLSSSEDEDNMVTANQVSTRKLNSAKRTKLQHEVPTSNDGMQQDSQCHPQIKISPEDQLIMIRGPVGFDISDLNNRTIENGTALNIKNKWDISYAITNHLSKDYCLMQNNKPVGLIQGEIIINRHLVAKPTVITKQEIGEMVAVPTGLKVRPVTFGLSSQDSNDEEKNVKKKSKKNKKVNKEKEEELELSPKKIKSEILTPIKKKKSKKNK